MNTNYDVFTERDRLWFSHPIITESAVLPTKAVELAVKRVLDASRKARSSIAFWADPLSGKSSCLRMIDITVSDRIQGCGVLIIEAVEDKNPAEGRLLIQILKAIGYANKIDISLAGKRDQVNRALYALSGSARHLFILIDEAQEFCNDEFGWLKAVINGLSRNDIKVTTVLFGQKELLQNRDELNKNGRSDLGVRFMKHLVQFKCCSKSKDICKILEALDEHSEYPLDSGLTYTQFLFPRAFIGGFRFKHIENELWQEIQSIVPAEILKQGITMDVIASIIANLCIQAKDLDSTEMTFSNSQLNKAVKSGFAG